MLVMTKTEMIEVLARKRRNEFIEEIEKKVQDDNIKFDSIGAKQREKDLVESNEIL